VIDGRASRPDLGILVGTDFNTGGRGIGPKTAPDRVATALARAFPQASLF
jgi:hypothetical protein